MPRSQRRGHGEQLLRCVYQLARDNSDVSEVQTPQFLARKVLQSTSSGHFDLSNSGFRVSGFEVTQFLARDCVQLLRCVYQLARGGPDVSEVRNPNPETRNPKPET